jgi:hypothetical protein
MKYDISKNVAPTMPRLGKGTECIKLLLSQASKDMHEALVPMFFPAFGEQTTIVNFSIQTSVGGHFVLKWLIWLQKVVVTRVNCHTS